MSSFLRASLARFTWRGFWSLQLLGATFNLLRFLQGVGVPQLPGRLSYNTLVTCLVPMIGMLSVYCADEMVQRGRSAWRAYLWALFVMGIAATALREICRLAFSLPVSGSTPSAVLNWWIQDGDAFLYTVAVGGVGMLAYYNRRSVERMMERLRAAELRRARLEQELVASRLATVQAEVNPTALFSSLAAIRGLYGTAPTEADRALDELIQALRNRRDPNYSGQARQ